MLGIANERPRRRESPASTTQRRLAVTTTPVIDMTTKPVLEPAAQEFADATAEPPYLFDLGPEKGRETVDEVQSGEMARPDADVTDTTLPGGPSGAVSVRILRPRGTTGPLP